MKILLVLGIILVAKAAFVGSEHLCVLVHGIMGTDSDLKYLGSRLEEHGCVVLLSQSNWWIKSLSGIETAAKRLVEEIHTVQLSKPWLRKISFVGNSLGGLFCRYAVKLLSRDSLDTHMFYAGPGAAPLQPEIFVSIATPHLGVLDYMWAEDRIGTLPSILKTTISWISRTMWQSGLELFFEDSEALQECILVRMGCDEEFLEPLRWFRKRRLYANLDLDFVVNLHTAAFLDPESVHRLRSENIYSGVKSTEAHVATQLFSEKASDVPLCRSVGSAPFRSLPLSERESIYATIRSRLDSLGWEKVIVYFPTSLPLALAHNKIASLRRPWTFGLYSILGFDEGDPVMDEAAAFVAGRAGEVESEPKELVDGAKSSSDSSASPGSAHEIEIKDL
uniref:DUF676 domain-containing protein n=1 Tax=uncultured organism MedDCM-OCT-S04-C12 TaxID=743608 RepID=D6PJ16_9ZZZZ|nr:unknown protein [uncultured organism MedDCM-OCT-S04-C12]